MTTWSECIGDPLVFIPMWWRFLWFLPYQIPHRVFTLDVALALLELPEREADSTLSLEHQRFLKHKFLVQDIMFDRCLDKAPTVRSKALSSFAHCLELSVNSASESILEFLINSKCGDHHEMKLILCLSRNWTARESFFAVAKIIHMVLLNNVLDNPDAFKKPFWVRHTFTCWRRECGLPSRCALQCVGCLGPGVHFTCKPREEQSAVSSIDSVFSLGPIVLILIPLWVFTWSLWVWLLSLLSLCLFLGPTILQTESHPGTLMKNSSGNGSIYFQVLNNYLFI